MSHATHHRDGSGHLDDESRAILLGLAARAGARGLSHGQVIALFRARTGLVISKSTVQAARRRVRYADDDESRAGVKLSRRLRAVLDRLTESTGPTRGSAWVAEEFRRRTGRKIHRSAVTLRARVLGVALASPGGQGFAAAKAEALRELIGLAAPRFNSGAIARRYERIYGERVAPSTVRKHMRRIGVSPPPRRGTPNPRLRRAESDGPD